MLNRLALCLLVVVEFSFAACTAIAAPADVPVKDILLNFQAADGEALEAKLTVPVEAPAPVPVVFYVHGAGFRTYDNPISFVGADGKRHVEFFFDYLARECARRGMGFCRMSKRGCKSLAEAPWMKIDQAIFAGATPTVMLGDYERCLDALRQRPEIDSTRIIITGSSEGTRIGPLLAMRSPKGIIAVVLNAFAADNARDTVVWQNSEGPWRNIMHLIPSARDGSLTRAEYDQEVANNPAIEKAFPFDAADADHDGVINAASMAAMVKPRLDLILKSYSDGDDAMITRLHGGLSLAYFQDWWDAESNTIIVQRVDVPIAIFHGSLDGTCRVEGVYEAQRLFIASGRDDVTVRVYPTANHDLNWTREEANGGGPQAYREMYDLMAEYAGVAAQARD